jgi:NitT/TauT family transport system permease protein
VLHDDWPRLLDSLLHSLGLLGLGVLLGTSCGFITGLAIGWSQRIGYWVHPVLRLLGPVPSTALLPLCLFIFLQLRRQRVFDRAEHLVPGHGADLVRGYRH